MILTAEQLAKIIFDVLIKDIDVQNGPYDDLCLIVDNTVFDCEDIANDIINKIAEMENQNAML